MSDAVHASVPIVGVELKPLRTHADDRGFFREIIRHTDPVFVSPVGAARDEPLFAQWSHSRMGRNTVKAWHFHHLQFDWWYVARGRIEVALCDWREESPSYRRMMTFAMGDDGEDAFVGTIRIPPGVLHGAKVTSDTADLLYVTSRVYDPQDEGRIPFNSPDIPYDWGDEASIVVATNDRRLFVPKYERQPLAS